VESAEPIREHAGLQESLRGVIAAGEEGIAGEGENDRIGVQGSYSTKRSILCEISGGFK
jgi:hypothetical protein